TMSLGSVEGGKRLVRAERTLEWGGGRADRCNSRVIKCRSEVVAGAAVTIEECDSRAVRTAQLDDPIADPRVDQVYVHRDLTDRQILTDVNCRGRRVEVEDGHVQRAGAEAGRTAFDGERRAECRRHFVATRIFDVRADGEVIRARRGLGC